MWLRGDVLSVVMSEDVADGRLSRGRRTAGFAVAVVGVAALSYFMLPDRESISLESVLLLFVLISVVAAAVGGLVPAGTAAVLGFLSANFLFTPPYDTLFVEHPAQLLDLILFLAIAAGMGVIVEAGSRDRVRAARARTLAAVISELDHREYGDRDNVDRVLIDTLDALGVDRAELFADGEQVAVAGLPEGDLVAARIPAGERLELVLYGPGIHGVDGELLAAFGNTAGRLWRSEQFAVQAIRAEEAARAASQRSRILTETVDELPRLLAGLRTTVEEWRGRDGFPELLAVTERLEGLVAGQGEPTDVPGVSGG